MKRVEDYLEENKNRFVEELLEFLRIESVSNNENFRGEMMKAAAWLKEKIEAAGAGYVEIFQTLGHPVVYAEQMVAAHLPTVLVYGHYDVQPPDPLELWENPPFEPIIKKTKLHPEGAIFARGACDDKGQLYMHIKALEILNKTGELPCNIKFLFEGEEEVGSSSLSAFCKKHIDLLACDVVLISDTALIAKDVPSITIGLRGLSYMEVEVSGPNRDLHSGTYGGAVANPINILCKMIGSLTNGHNHITIPGFYDDVVNLESEAREMMNKTPFDIRGFQSELGISAVSGEEGFTTLERASIRPTLDVNGIWGGYTGVGAKTVLPSKAFAKISMRLVPNQDPDKITRQFINYFKSLAPESVHVDVTPHHGGLPFLVSTDSPEYRASAKAIEETFGKPPIPQRSGGTIPIVALFEEELGVQSILLGFGLDNDNIHSPNEHYGLFNFNIGIRTIVRFFHYYPSFVKKSYE